MADSTNSISSCSAPFCASDATVIYYRMPQDRVTLRSRFCPAFFNQIILRQKRRIFAPGPTIATQDRSPSPRNPTVQLPPLDQPWSPQGCPMVQCRFSLTLRTLISLDDEHLAGFKTKNSALGLFYLGNPTRKPDAQHPTTSSAALLRGLKELPSGAGHLRLKAGS